MDWFDSTLVVGSIIMKEGKNNNEEKKGSKKN